jgi:outer membrane protein assembly factor BamA
MKIPIQIKLFFQQFKNYGDESGPYVRRFGLQYSNIFRWNRQRSFLDIGARFELFDKSEAFNNQIEQRKFKIHLHQDNRDNPIYPQKGNVLVFQLNSFGGVLGGNRTYNKYDIDLRQYLSPLKNITIAGRINVGMISGWKADYDKDDSVEIERVLYEKFYLGGSNTLRGLRPLRFFTHATDNVDNNDDGIVDDSDESDKIPSGKTAKFLTNWEIRFPLFWKVGAVLFYDGGSISNDLITIKSRDLRWNRGVGITINLPIGPIRIDYGEDLNDPNIKQFHFGLLYAF